MRASLVGLPITPSLPAIAHKKPCAPVCVLKGESHGGGRRQPDWYAVAGFNVYLCAFDLLYEPARPIDPFIHSSIHPSIPITSHTRDTTHRVRQAGGAAARGRAGRGRGPGGGGVRGAGDGAARAAGADGRRPARRGREGGGGGLLRGAGQHQVLVAAPRHPRVGLRQGLLPRLLPECVGAEGLAGSCRSGDQPLQTGSADSPPPPSLPTMPTQARTGWW